jgi:hypothetical protein
MSYQFRVFKYSEFISLIWKGPYYGKISVTSIKKELPGLQEDSVKSTAQQNSDLEFIVQTA